MKATSRRGALPALALLAAAAVVLAGCSRGAAGPSSSASVTADPGISDTSIDLGMTTPLSGALANPGNQALAGLQSYLDALNAAGGVTFGDGKTRTVELKSYDDGYDPARAVANVRQEIAENKFANVGSVGTATNLAIMPITNQNSYPNMLVQSGADALSDDQAANPWTLGFLPTYSGETAAFGRYLASLGKPVTVAVLQQNDDAGKAWLEGLQEGIKGSDVTIAQIATFEVGDPNVDSQMAKLAATHADLFFEAQGQLNIIPQSMLKAQELGWTPSLFLPSVASGATQSIVPGNGKAFAAVYSAAFSKDPSSPTYAGDADVQKFKKDLAQYAPPAIAQAPTGQAVWGYQIGATLEAAFKVMKQPTRSAFVKAIHSLKDIELPLLLKGSRFDATSTTQSPLTADVVVQRYDFEAKTYTTATKG